MHNNVRNTTLTTEAMAVAETTRSDRKLSAYDHFYNGDSGTLR
jgi:hypothetical protein